MTWTEAAARSKTIARGERRHATAYEKRIASGLRRGLTKGQAVGHPSAPKGQPRAETVRRANKLLGDDAHMKVVTGRDKRTTNAIRRAVEKLGGPQTARGYAELRFRLYGVDRRVTYAQLYRNARSFRGSGSRMPRL